MPLIQLQAFFVREGLGYAISCTATEQAFPEAEPAFRDALDGLRFATGRIHHDHLESRAWCVNTSARALPFRAHSFDAIVHTDVLC